MGRASAEELIGFGSLTVVLLAGLFTGMALASQSGMTLDQFGARPIVGRGFDHSHRRLVATGLDAENAHRCF